MKQKQKVIRAADTGLSDWSVSMARAQLGDRQAYRQLLLEIAPYVRSLARRRGVQPTEVEDAVQDTLLTLHAIRHTYDPRRPFGPWIVAVASRRIVDHLRRQGRMAKRRADFDISHETYSAPETNINETLLDRDKLRQAIERLPAGQRQAITLLKLREMSLKEASRESGLSVTALKVATHRAMKALREMFGQRR